MLSFSRIFSGLAGDGSDEESQRVTHANRVRVHEVTCVMASRWRQLVAGPSRAEDLTVSRLFMRHARTLDVSCVGKGFSVSVPL